MRAVNGRCSASCQDTDGLKKEGITSKEEAVDLILKNIG